VYCWKLFFSVGTPGDFVECGVWRGGASIFARAVMVAYQQDRRVWLFDSFEGLPKAATVKDTNMWSHQTYLRVSMQQVQSNFERFGLYDPEKVKFVKGYFSQTIRNNLGFDALTEIAVIRVDGDMYESCFDILANFYSKVAVGGYVIIDDWSIPSCRSAVNDIRNEVGILEDLATIDVASVFWQKSRTVPMNVTHLYTKFIYGFLN